MKKKNITLLNYHSDASWMVLYRNKSNREYLWNCMFPILSIGKKC